LMKLLPELQELVNAVSNQSRGMQQKQAPKPAGGMPRNMGALGNM